MLKKYVLQQIPGISNNRQCTIVIYYILYVRYTRFFNDFCLVRPSKHDLRLKTFDIFIWAQKIIEHACAFNRWMPFTKYNYWNWLSFFFCNYEIFIFYFTISDFCIWKFRNSRRKYTLNDKKSNYLTRVLSKKKEYTKDFLFIFFQLIL